MPSYKQQHDGIVAWLRPRPSPDEAWVFVAGCIVVTLMIGLLQAPFDLTAAGLALLTACTMAGGAWLIHLEQTPLRLEATARRLTVTPEGGWFRRTRSWSMLDVYRVVAHPDGIWIVPHPGPLHPVHLYAAGTPLKDLEDIVAALTTLAKQGETYRGEHPHPDLHKLNHLVGDVER